MINPTLFRLSSILPLLMFFGGPAQAGKTDQPVNVTADRAWIDVLHKGRTLRIQRNPKHGNMIDLEYALTSRPCPPYCIQPMVLAPGVETLGELELLDYLQRMSRGDDSIMVIDSREPHWLDKGMIPGAVSLPWTELYNKTTSDKKIAELLEFRFGAARTGEIWSFQGAKTLVFYCNGPWCGQSPTNIRALINLGYPADKLKWYRGGMQSWKQFGLTEVTP